MKFKSLLLLTSFILIGCKPIENVIFNIEMNDRSIKKIEACQVDIINGNLTFYQSDTWNKCHIILEIERGGWRSFSTKAKKVYEVNNEELEIQDAEPNYVEN